MLPKPPFHLEKTAAKSPWRCTCFIFTFSEFGDQAVGLETSVKVSENG
jgi:hypothetical protein